MTLKELKKADRNPKGHDIPGIQASLRRFGFVDPMVINERTGKLSAGHGRVEALTKMKTAGEHPPKRVKIDPKTGEWRAPVLRGIEFDNDNEAEAFLIAHNQLTMAGKWEKDGLAQIMNHFAQQQVPLGGLGFTERQVGRLLAVPALGDQGKPQLAGLTYSVIVECADEDGQTELLERLEGEGFKCKPLVT